MPAPVEHVLFVSIFEEYENMDWTKSFYGFIIIVLFVIGPDMDKLPGYLLTGNGGIWHREFTHSLLYVYLTGLVGPLILFRFGIYNFTARQCMALTFSHIFADYVLAPSPTALFWPWPLTPPWPYDWLMDYILPYDWQRPVGDTITAVLFSALLGLILVYVRHRKTESTANVTALF